MSDTTFRDVIFVRLTTDPHRLSASELTLIERYQIDEDAVYAAEVFGFDGDKYRLYFARLVKTAEGGERYEKWSLFLRSVPIHWFEPITRAVYPKTEILSITLADGTPLVHRPLPPGTIYGSKNQTPP